MDRDLPRVVRDCHETLRWFIPQIDRFPRQRRFTLGERLESGLLEVLELLTEATYTRNNGAVLRRANRRLAVVRHLWRLGYELRVVAHRAYEQGARRLVALGRQIGGWQKHGAGDEAAG